MKNQFICASMAIMMFGFMGAAHALSLEENDLNKDNVISWPEYRDQQPVHNRGTEAKQRFSKFDDNKDGFISADEITKFEELKNQKREEKKQKREEMKSKK